MSAWKPLPFAFVLSLASACSSGEATDDVPTPAGDGGQGGAPDATRPTECGDGPGRTTPPDRREVGVVEGKLIDETGAPAPTHVQICGRDICIDARVDGSGHVYHVIRQTLDQPACKYGDGLDFAKLAFPLAEGDAELGELITVRLPDGGEAAPLRAGATVTSGDVSLTLAQGAGVELDLLTYDDPTFTGLRAVRLPEPVLQQLGQDFSVAYALSPVETKICPPPALRLQNVADLPAAADLELYVLGLDVLEGFAPYAGWQKVGEGRVSEDGRTLEFSDGPPILTAIGIRER